MKIFKFLCLSILLNQFASANLYEHIARPEEFYKSGGSKSSACCLPGCIFAEAAHAGGPSDFYTVNAPSYPATVPLSLNRNIGETHGDIELNSMGITITTPGTYLVNFEAILFNTTGSDEVISVFLVENDTYDPNNLLTLGSTATLPASGAITPIQANGILANVPAGTKLSLVVSNGDGNPSDTVTVAAWFIVATKIPCQ